MILMADFLSVAGLWFGIFANLQLLVSLIPSDFFKSLILMVGPLFLILFSPYAGTCIDRYSVKTIISLSGVVQLIASILQYFAYDHSSIALLVFSLIFLNVANAFYTPALKSVIPAIVSEENLLKANATYMNTTTFARMIITGITGVSLAIMPLEMMYLITIGCYIGMNMIRLFLSFGIKNKSKKEVVKRLQFREVFILLKNSPVLIILMVNITLIYIFLGGSNLIILKLSEIHKSHPMQGFLYGVEGIFVFIAGIGIKKYTKTEKLLKLNTLLVIGSGVSVLVLFLGTYWMLLGFIGYGLYGFCAGCWSPTYSTLNQMSVPGPIRGRFFAFQEMWNRTSQQLALMYTGFMFDLVGVKWHLFITAFIIIIGAVVILIKLSKNEYKPINISKALQ